MYPRSIAKRPADLYSRGMGQTTESENTVQEFGSEYRAARRQRIKRAVDVIKTDAACADCGYDAHPAALQFDHAPGCDKRGDIGRMVSTGVGMTAILAEAAKCEVVCANCHAIRESDRRAEVAA